MTRYQVRYFLLGDYLRIIRRVVYVLILITAMRLCIDIGNWIQTRYIQHIYISFSSLSRISYEREFPSGKA
jgi:hypothetical protein